MTDTPTAQPDALTEAEQEAAFRQHLAHNVEATRAGMMAAAMDMAVLHRDNGLPHSDAILTTAALEFAVQLWVQVMVGAGKRPSEIRKGLDRQVVAFYRKHLAAARGDV